MPAEWWLRLGVAALVAFSLWYVLRKRHYEREPIPRWMRRRVYSRDGQRCQNPWCRSTEDLTVDHIVPVVRGGRSEVDNLQTLCRRCNSRKGTDWMPRWPIVRHLWWLKRML